jgi:hypothetical protein
MIRTVVLSELAAGGVLSFFVPAMVWGWVQVRAREHCERGGY